MIINDNSKTIKNISGINSEEIELIKAFLQGAVYCWVKNKEDEVFALRDLMGGENTYWEGTPLDPLYKKHREMNKDNEGANKTAGQDAGHILKLVLKEDKRKFKMSDAGMTNGYEWVK